MNKKMIETRKKFIKDFEDYFKKELNKDIKVVSLSNSYGGSSGCHYKVYCVVWEDNNKRYWIEINDNLVCGGSCESEEYVLRSVENKNHLAKLCNMFKDFYINYKR